MCLFPPLLHAYRTHRSRGGPEEQRVLWRADGLAERVGRAPKGRGAPERRGQAHSPRRLPMAKCVGTLRGFP